VGRPFHSGNATPLAKFGPIFFMSRASRKPRRPTARHAAESSSIWLTGFHPVREALRAGRRRLDRLWIRAGKQRAEQVELIELARSTGVVVEIVEPAVFEERVESEGNDQGAALRVGPLPELSLDELLDFAANAPGEGSRLVVLDGVEDPQNVGALARVAESAGVHGMILTQRRAPTLTPAISRASAGAIEWLRVARVSNLGRALSELQKKGYWVVAATPGSSATLFEMDDRVLTGNLAVVLGAEGKGIRRSILEQTDHLVEIPMRGKIASLNVATAGAIILYDLLRRSESAAEQLDCIPGGVG
jgi:23S rRNA (guanosine2251-2'-O)-methyltransferase